MHYAYKKSMPPGMYLKYHRMAIKCRGPNLRVSMSSLTMHLPMPILPAKDRMTNYSTTDLDVIMLENSNRTVIFTPPDEDDSHEQERLLDEIANELRNSTQAHIQDKFNESILDSVFDTYTDGKQPRTRDCLKQMIEGACSDCDVIGIDAVNEFERHLTELRAFCNERKKNQDATSKDDMYISRMVPMTQDSYAGTTKRIHNMHHM